MRLKSPRDWQLLSPWEPLPSPLLSLPAPASLCIIPLYPPCLLTPLFFHLFLLMEGYAEAHSCSTGTVSTSKTRLCSVGNTPAYMCLCKHWHDELPSLIVWHSGWHSIWSSWKRVQTADPQTDLKGLCIIRSNAYLCGFLCLSISAWVLFNVYGMITLLAPHPLWTLLQRSRCSRISSLILWHVSMSPSVMGTECRLDVPVTKLPILSDSQIHHVAMGTDPC